MKPGNERDMQVVRQDFEEAGRDLVTAMQEVAAVLGGEEFAGRIATVAAMGEDETLPPADAFAMLVAAHPESAELVFERAKEIQQARHEQELAEIRRSSLRKHGKGILAGMSGFVTWAIPRPRAQREISGS